MTIKKYILLPIISTLFLLSSCAEKSDLEFSKVYNLKGHTKDIWSLAFRPDGKELLSGSADSTVKIWNMDNGELIKTLTNHKNSVYGLAYNSKGNKFATASYDGVARIWDDKTKEKIVTFKEHMLGIDDILLTADGRVITCSQDRTIKIWDSKTGQIYQDNQVQKTVKIKTKSLSLNPNGREFLSSSTDGYIKIWDVITGKEIKSKKLDTGTISSAVYSHDGSLIGIAGADKSVRILQSDTLNEIYEMRGHNWNINAVAFSPDDKYIISGSTDKKIIIWDVKTGNKLGSYYPEVGAINTISYGSTGLIAVGGIENTITVFKFEKKVN